MTMLYRRNHRGSAQGPAPLVPRPSPLAPRPAVAATELALLMPLLMLLTVGTIDFARIVYGYVTISTCARNAGLWACDPRCNGTITPSNSPYGNITAAVQADAGNLSTLPTVDTPQYSSTVNGTYSTTPV